jgi:WD40 repeat protein
MRYWTTIALGMCGLTMLAAQGQQPPKGPTLPPVNPALAKLDITIAELDGPGFAIAYGAEADLLVVACDKGTIQAYSKDAVAAFKGGKGTPTTWKGHGEGPAGTPSAVRTVRWHGGATMVSVGADKKIHFWKMPEGKIAQTAIADFRVRAADLSTDGKTFAAGGESDVIQLFDAATGKPTTKLADNMDWTLSLAFSADGKQLLSADNLGVVRLWEVPSGKKLATLPAPPMPAPKTPPEPIAVTCVAFGPDPKSALLGNAEGLIQVINLGDGKIVRTLTGHTGPITGFALHPTGTVLASVSKDRTVKLWNPAAPQPAVQALKSLDGHGAWIEGVVFIDQATKLATVGADRTVRIWDLAEPPKKK